MACKGGSQKGEWIVSDLQLGKLPARPNAIKLKFSSYLSGTKALSNLPDTFGHEEWTPPIDWGVLGNAEYGDCVIAGGAHECMLWSRIGGNPCTFNTVDVLRDFQNITGVPPDKIHGADVQKAAHYRLTTGLLDAAGKRHTIAGYVGIQAGNLAELYRAIYEFDAVGIGIQFPTTAFDQFTNHQAWQVVRGARTMAGHYIPAFALRGNIVVVTWGRFQAVRPSFLGTYMDEGIVYLSRDSLVNGKSPHDIDYAGLMADLQTLNG
jgi:hypothetical protein